MARAVICKGDPTSHGGQVLEGDPAATIDGRPIALRGHLTYCPLCKGKFPISEGLDHHSFGGIGTALEGMKTACGATLIATQHFMTVDDPSDSGIPTSLPLDHSNDGIPIRDNSIAQSNPTEPLDWAAKVDEGARESQHIRWCPTKWCMKTAPESAFRKAA